MDILQNLVTVFPKPFVIMLSPDALAGVFFTDAVPVHQPPDPVFHRRGDGNGHIAQLRQASFKEGNGIDGCKGRLCFQQPQHLCLYGPVGDGVEIRQGLLIGKNEGTQLLPLKGAVFRGAGEPGFNGGKQRCVSLQQPVVNGIAVQNKTAQIFDAR